jgi:hypothetical protein
MLMSKGDLLFNKFDLHATLDKQGKRAREAVMKLPEKEILGEAEEALVSKFTPDYIIEPIELLENGIEVEYEDAQVDVSRDPMRNLFRDPGPIYLAGQSVRYLVPFRGERQLFDFQGSTRSFNPPRALVEDSNLVFEYQVVLNEVAQTKIAFQEGLANVKQHLGWISADLQNQDQHIKNSLRTGIQQRRAQLDQAKQQIETLGYPVRKKESSTPEKAVLPEPKSSHQYRSTRNREYDVALSFAGEDREYVEEVARILKAAGVKVFYDKFETVQLWGRNLADHLGDVYGKRSRFVVIFISKYYPLKAWPKHERKSAQALAIRENKIVLLPARFDDTEIDGMPSSTAYVDLRKTSTAELAKLIQEKLEE